MMILTRFERCGRFVAFAALLAFNGAALAQTTAPTTATSDQLADIVVTAQKRSENAQSVPISVHGLSASELESVNVTEVKDLQNVDTSLRISGNQGITSTYVRGLGTIITTIGAEQSVPIYIDDVYYVHSSAVWLDLADIDNVQLLKGPQGTLFGRNASAGVLSITTRDPGQQKVLEVTAGYANYNDPYGKLYASTPLSNDLAMDISVSGHDQRAGWGSSLAAGWPTYISNSVSLRSKIVWTPSEDTTVKGIIYYANFVDTGLLVQCYQGTVCGGTDSGLTGAFTPPFVQHGFYNSELDFPDYVSAHGWGGSVRVDQALSFADFVSISAGRWQGEINKVDGDNTPQPFSEYSLNGVDNQVSEELQLKSKSDSKVKWIAGFFYLHAKQGYNPTEISSGYFDQVLGFPFKVDIIGTQVMNSYAGFGQVTYPITSDTNITGGTRYNIDKISALGFTNAPGSATFDGDPSNTFKKWSYLGSLDHHFTDNLMVYASVSRGFKSAFYSTLPLNPTPLQPETNQAYELGVKTTWLDNRLRVDGAYFYNSIKNPQVQSSINGLAIDVNAGSAYSKGLELEADAAIGGGFTVSLSGTWLDAKYTDFPNAPLFIQRPDGGNSLSSVNADGNYLPLAARYRAVATLIYDRDIGSLGKMGFAVNASYTGGFPWDPDNVIWQRATTIIDSSLKFTPGNTSMISYRLWVKNLTNKEYDSFEFPQQGTAGYSSVAAPPRTYGGEVSVKF